VSWWTPPLCSAPPPAPSPSPSSSHSSSSCPQTSTATSPPSSGQYTLSLLLTLLSVHALVGDWNISRMWILLEKLVTSVWG
jgi:hypothetical protein